jgi:cobaltochelatase CobS
MTTEDGKIACAMCGAHVHIIQSHLSESHPGMTVHEYTASYPFAPIMSEKAKAMIAERAKAKEKSSVQATPSVSGSTEIDFGGGFTGQKAALHELFDLGATAAAKGWSGNPIPIHTFNAPPDLSDYVPAIDRNYVWPIALLKKAMLALEMNIPAYLWGHAGTGKSTMWKQICARTGRPTLRAQHTVNTEEAHILGQWVVKDGATVFELGPLPFCMKYGLTYLADEYDFAMPSVLSVYQPVLEGEPLVMKEADAANRVIKPHPLFRIVATGNTNGTGDETGLYQGTTIQNAANYERFGLVEEVHYMEAATEIIVVSQQGGIPKEKADSLVKFAGMIREAHNGGKIGLPISPRALINAAKLGKRVNSLEEGLAMAYINRLSRVDQEAAREVLKRMSF